MANTLASNNEFRFNCPSLQVEVKLSDCITLRDRVWRGERMEERRGCQACMASSKCAAATIVHDMWLFKVDPGYFSATPKVGALDASIPTRLGRVIVQEKTLDQFGVVDAERNVLLRGNEKTSKSPEIDTSDWAQPKKTTRRTTKPIAPAPASADVAAAMSGDMSAALNKAAGKPAPVAAPEPKPKSKPPQATPVSSPTGGLSLMERARQLREGKAA